MIYVDTSVVLAALLSEDRQPSPHFWDQELVASWLTMYEVWNRLHAYRVGMEVQDEARSLLAPLLLIDLSAETLARALDPFPKPLKTLDGLHLATMDYMRRQGHTVTLASYDRRLMAAANAMGLAACEL